MVLQQAEQVTSLVGALQQQQQQQAQQMQAAINQNGQQQVQVPQGPSDAEIRKEKMSKLYMNIRKSQKVRDYKENGADN